jgi:transcriptional regulator with XRE-family HTH domain
MAGYSAKDFEQAEEVTTAMAQSLIFQAMQGAGFTAAELARRLGVNRSRIPQILQQNMTLRTLARTLAACGYEVRFSLKKGPAR